MAKSSLTPSNITTLVTEATRAFEHSDTALDHLLQITSTAMGAVGAAIFSVPSANDVAFITGRDSRLLKEQAKTALAEWHPGADDERPPDGIAPDSVDGNGPAYARVLLCDGIPFGVWAVLLPGVNDLDTWDKVSRALAPMMVLGLRQSYWHAEVQRANDQVERRVREIGTVYEIGRAIDKVDNQHLLRLITERAAAVMDAQACSLMLKQPGTNSLVIAASHGLPDQVVENTRIFIGQGISGRVAATGEPLLLQSLADAPMFRGQNVEGVPGVASSICMPMKDESGDVIGVLCIRRSARAASFNDADLRLFGIFATHATLAINNAKLYQKLNNKLQELSTLSALTETISSTLDLDQVLNQVADNIVDVVKFDRCRIYLSDIDTGRFSARIVRGFPWPTETISPGPSSRGELPVDGNIGLGEGIIGMVAQRQAPLLIEDPDEAPTAAQQYARSLDMRGFYAQPIVLRGRCIGVVVVSHTDPKPLAQSNIELLSTFVHQAGIAIENARFYAGQERRYAELATLYDVSRTLSATSGVQHAAQTVNDLATKITDSDAGVLLYFETSKDELRALHWRGVSESLEGRLRSAALPLAVPPSAKALRVPRLLSADDAGSIFGPEWQPFTDAFLARHRSVALVPLVVDNAAVGFLVLGKQRAEYGLEELKLIAVASSQAASVLSAASHYERRIGQRDLELSAVYELMQKVRSAKTLEEALNSILDIVASMVWSDQAALYTVDPGQRTLTVRAAQGVAAKKVIGSRALPLDGDSIAAKALRERRAMISSGDEAAAEFDDSPIRAQSLLAIPLVVGDEMVGVLTLLSEKPDIYTEDSIMMLHLVTSQAATIYREMSSFRVLTRYTENILRSIAAGVITIDKDGIIVTWNARAEDIVNLRAEQIVGLHYSEFIQRLQIDPKVREETMRMLEMTAKTGKVFTRNQLCYHTPQGEEMYVNLSASQLKSESGEYLGVVVVFEDITHEIQMKEEVERVSKLAETGQLAANIAHELRNPLSSIKGAAQLLRNEMAEEWVEEHAEFFNIIIDEVNGLNRMTTEFLEFSRVTPPQMDVINLNNLLAKLVGFMSTYFKDEDVTVDLDLSHTLPHVYMDKTQIEQVVRNIVINAAQAMPHGGKLSIATHYIAEQDIAEIQFQDTGVGIPANKQEKIFTPFFTTKTKGTGLGLAIARKIVDTHGGRITVRSTPGEGSCFIVQLPVHPAQTNMLPPSRTDITDQRSDQPGGYFELPRTEPTTL
jgi:PAS domain S-box-containing protein